MTTFLSRTLFLLTLSMVIPLNYSIAMEDNIAASEENFKIMIALAACPIELLYPEDVILVRKMVWEFASGAPCHCINDITSCRNKLNDAGKFGAFYTSVVANPVLDLSNNFFGDLSAKEIGDFFSPFLKHKRTRKIRNFLSNKSTLLAKLKAESKNTETPAAYVKELFTEYPETDSPEEIKLTINLAGNYLGCLYQKGRDQTKKIVYVHTNPSLLWRYLAEVPNLCELDLSNNDLNILSTSEIEEMLNILSQSKHLKKINLNGNQLPQKTIESIQTLQNQGR